MSLTWTRRESWVAVFDVLGFAKLVAESGQDFPRAHLTDQLDELLGSLESDEQHHGSLEYLVFSDTIVIFSSTQEPSGYPWFLLQCKNLIKDSIRLRLPLRGAISVGTTFVAAEHPIVLGVPFCEAFEYCADQDWIGLLLAPSATHALRRAGLEPLHHHFVTGPVPLRRLSPDDVLAYRLQDGMANFDSPLLPLLREMQHFAPPDAKEKYARTIKHIQHHHRSTDG